MNPSNQDLSSLMPEVAFPVDDSALSKGVPVRSRLGLPLARLIPQDIHSLVDYATALAVGVAGFVAEQRRARIVGRAVGAVGLLQSLASDYRLSAVKLMPIELHELGDYVWGAVNLAAPFALRYRRKERVASAIQIAAGATLIAIALFTDYRGWKRRRIGFTRG
jgi:hypothetical protein